MIDAIVKMIIKNIVKVLLIGIKSTSKVLNHKLVKLAIYNMKKQINTETIPINFFLKYMNTRLQIKSNTIDGESTNKNKTTEGTIIPIIEI